MPSLVEGDDRQTVKRTVPKASNKIHAVGVAKLYIATPGRPRWTYTGLQGAAVLANDLVGHTYWIKLVDLSPANRGVIWDQEIYDTFQYNQDRVFFHSFELEGCMAGFSFADDKEAKKFKQKMDEREKNAHKNTKARPFGSQAGQTPSGAQANGKSHGILGGFGSLLHRDRQTSATHAPAQSIIPPKEVNIAPRVQDSPEKDHGLGIIDPALLDELLAMGITEDQLAEHADFIKMWVEQRKSSASAGERRQKPPPPPAPVVSSLSPQSTGDTSSSRKGPPPAPPQPRRGGNAPSSASPAREESPPPGVSKRFNFKAPPPLVGAGKFADDAKGAPSPRATPASTNGTSNGPRLPSRPPKTPLDERENSTRLVSSPPPPAETERQVPPPPPARNTGPPPSLARGPVPEPPPRERAHSHAVPPPIDLTPPPLPPKIPNAQDDHASGPPPPPRSRGPIVPASPPSFPSRDGHSRTPSLQTGRSSMESRAVPPPPSSHAPHAAAHAPPPPPPWPSTPSAGPPPPPARSEPIPASAPLRFDPPPPPPSMPSRTTQPPPPPMPSRTEPPHPPAMPSTSRPPPSPPRMPSGSGPPPPPPLPSAADPEMAPVTANAPAMLTADGQRGGLLSDIRGGAKLKKVSDAEKRDRSGAAVPGGDAGGGNTAGGSSGAPAGADQGGLAGALASALAARKSKVSQSDDEDDKDDW